MKKIIFLILAFFVLYIVSIFMFPWVSSFLWDKLGLTNFNNNVIKIKNDIDNFFTNFDIVWTYEETIISVKDLKISLDENIKYTQDKIDLIRSGMISASESITQVKEMINNTIENIESLQKYIELPNIDEIEKTQTLEEIQKLQNKLDELKTLEKELEQ